jgi:hypothetical protein
MNETYVLFLQLLGEFSLQILVFFANTFMDISDLMTNHHQGVCHTCGLAIYITKAS